MDGTDKETTVAAAGTNGMEAAPAMAAGSGSCSCTVVEIDVDDDAEAAAAAPRRTRPRPSIYRVPNHIKNMTNPDAYRPRLVSLGPFHHGEAELQPMEKHKHRAVAHLVERSGKPLREFMAAVEEIAEQLRAAYEDLDDERWSGEEFVELMLTDGCFLLEVMRAFQLQREGKKEEVEEGGDYEADDPVFSEHGYLYLRCDIISDVLVMENQLPLLLLDKLCHVAYADNLQEEECLRINDDSVLSFLFSSSDDAPAIDGPLGLHPVDVVQRNIRGTCHQNSGRRSNGVFMIPCAAELQEAGIRFKVAAADAGGGFAGAITFRGGMLTIPLLHVMDSTESMFLNLMAFERMHPGAGNDAMAAVIFLDNLIDTARDVALLKSRGIISNLFGSDEAVAALFNELSRGAVMSPHSSLYGVQRQVIAHCKKRRNRWRASLVHSYFRNPWVFISLVAAFVLLAATVMQTIYTVIPFYTKS
ncbi:UPF0481 protein At3g47200-like [Oryza glaberrima]|uniref:Uncharacterized protein n=1 Tax=Oryza glaberrima TaxID=4538 RepID=I1R0T2_ORYGL|nr:UPF0481 protein At3g47200-like [Oryza glaberrima]